MPAIVYSMFSAGAKGYPIVRPVYWMLGLIVLFYFFNGLFYLRVQSVTFDESSFTDYAARLLNGHPERKYPQSDNSKMPVSVLNLLPRAIEQLFHPGLKKQDNGASDIFAGRYITLVFSLLIILLVFRWSNSLYGEKAALFSAFLMSFCPNLLANAGLVTTDCYSMLFLCLTMFFTWKFCNYPSYKNFIWLCLGIASSQLVKQSLIHLYILVPVIFLIFYSVCRPVIRWKSAVVYFGSFLFLNWLVINLGFYFRDSHLALGQYAFVSNTFQHVQKILPSWLPVPLPRAFVDGLDLSKYYDQIGGGNALQSSYGKVTILGNSSTGGSFWYYYIVSFLFKTPVSSLLFILSSCLLVFKNRAKTAFFKNEFFLLAPVIYYGIYMSFFYKTQIGIRQFIFVYPLLYILCGSMIVWIKNRYLQYVMVAMGIFLLFSVLRFWNNYYSFTNEMISDKKMAYRYVGSSNLEFGQSQFFFNQYLKDHPEIRMAPVIPAEGVFLIRLHDYMDIWNLHQFEWIRHIPPSGVVAYNGLLITVTASDLKSLQ